MLVQLAKVYLDYGSCFFACCLVLPLNYNLLYEVVRLPHLGDGNADFFVVAGYDVSGVELLGEFVHTLPVDVDISGSTPQYIVSVLLEIGFIQRFQIDAYIVADVLHHLFGVMSPYQTYCCLIEMMTSSTTP